MFFLLQFDQSSNNGLAADGVACRQAGETRTGFSRWKGIYGTWQRRKTAYEEDLMKRTFTVKAVWDNEAQVFYAQSDIEGLHIEAASLDEFEEIMLDAAPELIMANHRSVAEIAEHPLKDLIPAILWQRSETEREMA